jgi:beta-glucosidase
VHSGPEPDRHGFDAKVSEYDLVNTYLPAFRASVVEGKADSIMCVYNAVNGTPGCASADLLQKRLREEWGFPGYVVSDCGAVNDIYQNHRYAPTLGGAAVAAVKAGTDLTCGTEYRTLVDEVKAGRIAEAEIDRSLERLFVARSAWACSIQERVPYSKIRSPRTIRAHTGSGAERSGGDRAPEERGRRAARARRLWQDRGHGSSADDPVALLGNYNGISSRQVTPLEGLEKQFPAAKVRHALGATYTASTHALVPAAFLTPAEGRGSGVLVEYFDNPDLQGEPKLRRAEPRPYFDMAMEDPAVTVAVGHDKYSLRWTAADAAGDG